MHLNDAGFPSKLMRPLEHTPVKPSEMSQSFSEVPLKDGCILRAPRTLCPLRNQSLSLLETMTKPLHFPLPPPPPRHRLSFSECRYSSVSSRAGPSLINPDGWIYFSLSEKCRHHISSERNPFHEAPALPIRHSQPCGWGGSFHRDYVPVTALLVSFLVRGQRRGVVQQEKKITLFLFAHSFVRSFVSLSVRRSTRRERERERDSCSSRLESFTKIMA